MPAGKLKFEEPNEEEDNVEIAHERIYAALKDALIIGQFAPGEKMTVRGLASLFGTSPMPVREALRRLVADQALTQRANRGIVVPPLSLERLLDLRRVRMAIEGLAAEWAAASISEFEIGQLVDLQARMRGMVKSGESREYLAYNKKFHFAIYRAARSDCLAPVIESLWLQAGPYLTMMKRDTTLGVGLDHHDEVIAALRKADGPAARRAISADIGDAADLIIRIAAAGTRHNFLS